MHVVGMFSVFTYFSCSLADSDRNLTATSRLLLPPSSSPEDEEEAAELSLVAAAPPPPYSGRPCASAM